MRKIKLFRWEAYRITHTSKKSPFLGQRCHLNLLEQVEEHEPDEEGFIHNLAAYMLSGRIQGHHVDLPPCKVKIVSTRNCNCKAYKFPHAPGFGLCKQPKFEKEAPNKGVDLESLFPEGEKNG